MGIVILVIIIVVVLILSVRRTGKGVPDKSRGRADVPPVERPEPRDYLSEATSILNAPRPLSELVEQDRTSVVGNLLNALRTGGTMTRKSAAYALGQIGDPGAVEFLSAALSGERVEGVREALAAAITAINLAPIGSGKTDLDRRRIIEDVYHRRREPQLYWRSSGG